MPENEFEQRLITTWTKYYIAETADASNEIDRNQAIRKCHIAHYNELGMEDILEKYVGKIDLFISFLQSEWNWIVSYDREKEIIVADENKETCVCPLFNSGRMTSGNLCFCSEGFTEKMFSYVLQKPVKAEVIRSFIRDQKSCIYKISLREEDREVCLPDKPITE